MLKFYFLKYFNFGAKRKLIIHMPLYLFILCIEFFCYCLFKLKTAMSSNGVGVVTLVITEIR